MSVVIRSQASQAAVLANGVYPARLSAIKEFENSYGQRLGFEFTIQGGAHDGDKVMRSTSPHLTPKSKLAGLLRGLLGRDLSQAEAEMGFDIEDLVGVECNVLVSQGRGKSGQVYTNVESVFK
ncbi:MAG: hypothetical protein GY753_09940 [Gammaproteobacteria bacterium]|nr:hypothetical protein [Gammaproteobacteria bacterium]